MPSQRARIRQMLHPRRRHDLPPMQRIIMPPVLEFLPYPPADLKAQLRRHRDIPGIKQAVNVTPQQQAIARLMPAAVAIGTDVRGFQRRQGSFLKKSLRQNAAADLKIASSPASAFR
jgi:hypothetical protein